VFCDEKRTKGSLGRTEVECRMEPEGEREELTPKP